MGTVVRDVTVTSLVATVCALNKSIRKGFQMALPFDMYQGAFMALIAVYMLGISVVVPWSLFCFYHPKSQSEIPKEE